MLTIEEAVKKMNDKKATREIIAEEMNTSPTTLTRRIKKAGFIYNQKTKQYEKGTVENDMANSKVEGKEEKNNQEERKKSEEKKKSVIQKVELTENEIIKLKKIVEESDQNVLYSMLQLIPNEDANKRSIIITDSTFEEFDKFSDGIKHINKNKLVELALIDFMSRYRR